MNKIEFYILENWGKVNKPLTKEYALLSHFLDDIGRYFPYHQDDTIENLKNILKGEKTFADIQDPEVYWSYGEGSGYFEIEGTTAFFEPDSSDAPRIVMPLAEVIEIVQEWIAFLRQ
ncbi:hypothetical protein [uncultured Dokdonia sp.]|uniref:hypothetical protein n=1 Tax=uncultured Dokdonia sp. TaxID=575653 RepID=UPI002614E430|nr:hypothetical protein [uncultured Dokdonia sp.]